MRTCRWEAHSAVGGGPGRWLALDERCDTCWKPFGAKNWLDPRSDVCLQVMLCSLKAAGTGTRPWNIIAELVHVLT